MCEFISLLASYAKIVFLFFVQCHAMAQEMVGDLLNYLMAKYTPEAVCTALGICVKSAAPQEASTASVPKKEDCSAGGESYWCSSWLVAKRCDKLDVCYPRWQLLKRSYHDGRPRRQHIL